MLYKYVRVHIKYLHYIYQWSPTFLRSDPILNENVISVYTRPHFVFW